MYINVTVRRICVTLEGKKYYILWVYVSVNLGIRHAESLRHITICGLSGSTIFFTHYLTNGTIFEEKKLLDMKSVFLFYVQNLSETFLILRRIQWNHIINVLGLHVKYSLFLSDFNETWIFLTNFKKILKYQISRKSVEWQPSYFHDDGQTDRHERGSSRFSQFMEFLIPFGPEYSLPPGDNPIAVNKYYYYIFLTAWYLKTRTDKYA